MTIEPQLTPEVLAKNIQEFESQGVELAEVRANFLAQGGSEELWERAIEIIAAEKMVDQTISPTSSPVASRYSFQRWILLGVLVVLALSAGWWAWTGLKKNSFDAVIARVQRLVSPVEEDVVIPPVIPLEEEGGALATQPAETKTMPEDILPEPETVKRGPRPSGL